MNRVQRAHEHLVMPWANGKGVTYQVATFPPDADLSSFSWRISMADVPESGPFSVFTGIDRILTVIEPGDLRLYVNEVAVMARRHVPVAFSGDDDVRAELIDGPITDLNVMTRRGSCTAEVDVQRVEATFVMSAQAEVTRVVVVLDGSITTAHGELMNPRDALFITDDTSLDGPGTIAVITIHQG